MDSQPVGFTSGESASFRRAFVFVVWFGFRAYTGFGFRVEGSGFRTSLRPAMQQSFHVALNPGQGRIQIVEHVGDSAQGKIA